MAKGKKSVSHSGPHKKHGPKKKMFHCWDSTTRLALAKAGLLTKYNNRESFNLSVTSMGQKYIPDWLWDEMIRVDDDKKAQWFKDLKHRNLRAEDAKKEAERKAAEKKAALLAKQNEQRILKQFRRDQARQQNEVTDPHKALVTYAMLGSMVSNSK